MTSGTSQVAVDLGAYAHNLRYIRGRIPEECQVMAVVKANGYGLGIVPIAERALAAGVEMLGVAAVSEGIHLREAGITAPILVLLQPQEDQLGPAIKHGLRLALSDVATGERIGELARKAKRVVTVHCEIDTGMGRQGFNTDSALQEIMSLTRISNIDMEGVMTHFPDAETPNDAFSVNQLKTFRHLLRQLEKSGIPYEMAHASNSAGIVNVPNAELDLVRPGLMTFGVWPSSAAPPEASLRDVVTWRTRVALVRDVAGGANISYGRTWRAPSPIRTALVPVGYADGFPVALSNTGEVLIRGRRCPVRGRVCMDAIVVDVTHVPGVAAGDTVTLIGQDGSERIAIEDVARLANTIPYEILTGIGPRATRVYTD